MDHSYKKRLFYEYTNDNSNGNDDNDGTTIEQSISSDEKKHKIPKLTSSKDTDEVDSVNNHIYFYSSVNRNTALKLCKIIQKKNDAFREQYFNHRDIATITPQPIYLHINSYGGSVTAGFSIIDAILCSSIPIYTVIDGCAASAATLISIVGKRRYINRHAIMLIHQLSSGLWGKMNEIEDDYKNCTQFMNQIKNLYKEYTNIDENDLDDILKHDLWWDAEKCLKYKLVDDIYI